MTIEQKPKISKGVIILKEYVYLDMDLINSYLAQIDEGILLKVVSGQSTADSHHEDGGNEQTTETNGQLGIPGIANGGTKYSKTEIDKFSTVYSKNNSELIEMAMSDYSLDLLLSRLNEENLINEDSNSWIDGDFININDKLNTFNFQQLEQSVKKKNMENVLTASDTYSENLEELERLRGIKNKSVSIKNKISELSERVKEEDPYKNFRSIEKFASYMNVIFSDSILIKVGNTLSMCTKDSFRINKNLLSIYCLTKRKCNLLGLVISKKERDLAPGDNDEAFTSFETASESPAVFIDIMLTSFDISEIGDFYIRPIAIYFDQD